jgi:hypothetical protein
VKDGHLDVAALAPLLAALPPEQYVRTAVRGGEGFDSRRWPVANDAALARLALRRLGLPPERVDEALAAIDACAGDPARLRPLARMAAARRFAAAGAGPDLFSKLYRDPTPEELAVFAAPAPAAPDSELAAISAVIDACYQAADGLYAYHCHRGVPGMSAQPAATLVASALQGGGLTTAELVAEALELCGSGAR